MKTIARQTPFHMILFLVLAAAAAGAAENSPLEKLIGEISEKTEQALRAEFTEKKYAEENSLAYPVPGPDKTPKEILKACRDDILRQLQDSMPTPAMKELEARAALRYPLYRKGDRVVLETSHPSRPRVEGILNGIGEDRVIVDSRWVRMRDIADHCRRALDPVQTRHLRKVYMGELIQEHRQQRRKMLARKLQELFPQAMAKAGYLRDEQPEGEGKGKGMFDSSYWTSRKAMFQQGYEEKFNELKKRKIEDALQKALPGKGYCKDKRTGNWRPMTFMEKLKSKL